MSARNQFASEFQLLLAHTLYIPNTDVLPDHKMYEDLLCDDLDQIEIIQELEGRYQILVQDIQEINLDYTVEQLAYSIYDTYLAGVGQ